MRTRVLCVAAIGLLLLLVELVQSSNLVVPEATFERDVVAMLPRNTGSPVPMIHTALVAFTPADAAVLDAQSYPAAKGDELELEVGFRTATPKSNTGSRFGRFGPGMMGGSNDWRQRIRSSRELPPLFGSREVHLQITGRYLGEHEDYHGLRIDDTNGHEYAYAQGGGGGGSWHPPTDDLLVRAREPVVRLLLSDGLALFLMVTAAQDPEPFDPGQREMWLAAFEEAAELAVVLPDAALTAALEPGGARNRYRRFAPLGYGPAAELVGAALILHDADRAGDGLKVLRRDGALDRAFAAARRVGDAASLAFYEEHIDKPRRDLTKGLVNGRFGELPAGRDLMVLQLLRDGEEARRLVDVMLANGPQHDSRYVVLAEEELGATPEVVEQYKRLRAQATGALPFPWGLVAPSAWRLWAWLLFVPVMALVLVVVVQPPRTERPTTIQVTPKGMVLLGLFAFLTLCEFELAAVLPPVWGALAYGWLRSPGPHGVAERAVIWLGLTLVFIKALIRLGWYVDTVWLQSATGSGPLFCWCLVAFIIARDERWVRPVRFQWFLMGLVASHALGVVGAHKAGYAGVALLVFILAAYAGFVLGGRAGPRGTGGSVEYASDVSGLQ